MPSEAKQDYYEEQWVCRTLLVRTSPDEEWQFGDPEAIIARLRAVEQKYQELRKILANIPGKVVMEAKEKAGFPNFITTDELTGEK